MKVDLCGLAGNGARAIEDIVAELKRHMGPRDFRAFLEEHQPEATAFSLGELAAHVVQTKNGDHSIEEFADFYCIKPRQDAAEEK